MKFEMDYKDILKILGELNKVTTKLILIGIKNKLRGESLKYPNEALKSIQEIHRLIERNLNG